MSDTKNILQRMHAAMGEVDYVQKEKKQGMKYSIVSHDAVTALVRPILVKHGIVYYPVELRSEQDGNRTQAAIKIRFCNIDDRSDFIEVASLGYGLDDQDKGPGKAISYAVKYALLKSLGLETGDEPDEDQESKHRSAEGERLRLWLTGSTLKLDTATTLDELRKMHGDGAEKLVSAKTALPTEFKGYMDALARNKTRLEPAKAAE